MPRRVPTAKINRHHVGWIREKTRHGTRVLLRARASWQSRNREMVSAKKIGADRVRVCATKFEQLCLRQV